jgi:small subunit ribosomal protein S16
MTGAHYVIRGAPLPVAVKIKLQRLGKIRAPYYRVIVSDARTRRSGKAIETIGRYHPKDEPSLIEVDSERTQYWLGVGAQPTESVQRILEITGDWQKFKGLPGAEGTLKHAEAKPSKQELFDAALKAAGEEPTTEATTPKKKGGAKKTEAKKDEAKKDEAKKDEAKAEEKAEKPADQS